MYSQNESPTNMPTCWWSTGPCKLRPADSELTDETQAAKRQCAKAHINTANCIMWL
jgi:hypothetical protein